LRAPPPPLATSGCGLGDDAILHFVTPDPNTFARAANRVFTQPFKSVADT
jgi:hypothetical protein